MPHIDTFIPQSYLYLGRKFQQTQIVGYRRPLLPDPLTQFFLCQLIQFYQFLEGQCNLYGVQVFPLNVLDKSHLHQRFVLYRSHIGGNRFQPGHLCSSISPLSGNNLIISTIYLPQRNRLYNTQFPNRACQFFESFLIEFPTRLIGIRHNLG